MTLRLTVLATVFKRNFLGYFLSPLGYVFIVLFVGALAYWTYQPAFFANNVATLEQLNRVIPWLLMVMAPAIAMSTWAEERKQGTDELLFTFPATDLEILAGKYLATVGIYSVALACSLVFGTLCVMAVLTTGQQHFADFDVWLVLANYFGYWLAGVAFLALSMVASTLTNSVTVAFVLGVVACSIPASIGALPAWLSEGLKGFDVAYQLREFSLGIITFSSVLFFVSMIVVMMYLNYVLITRRHWAGRRDDLPMWLHFLLRVPSVAVVLICVNHLFAAQSLVGIDMTSDRVFTLHPETRKLLKNVKEDRPVYIQAFVSRNVPDVYSLKRLELLGILRQFESLGQGKVTVRLVETAPSSLEAEEAINYGIREVEIPTEHRGRSQTDRIFMGAAVTAGSNDEVVIPFFDVGLSIEYELARALKTVTQNERLSVGILETDAKLFGGFDMRTFSSTPEWRIVGELKKQYKVTAVSPDAPIEGKFDVLLAAMPSSLTEPQMQNFLAYVNSGRPVLIFDDPFPATFRGGPELAPRQSKPSPSGGMFGGGPPPQPKADNGRATRLLDALQIAWENGTIVWDQFNPHKEIASLVQKEVVFISPNSGNAEAFNSQNPITSGLSEMIVVFAGEVQKQRNMTLEFEPLLRTSDGSGTLAWEEFTDSSGLPFMGGGVQLKRDRTYTPPETKYEYVVAAYVHPREGDKGPRAIFCADLDMISDFMFEIRDRELYKLRLDNVAFVLNCVDLLANDPSLIPIRKRRARERRLRLVESATQPYIDQRVAAINAADEKAKKQIEEFERRRDEGLEKIRADKSMDEQSRAIREEVFRQQESRRLEVQRARLLNEARVESDKATAAANRKIDAVEGRIQTLAVLLPPLPALLLGLLLYSVRRAGEQRGISDARLRRA